MDYIAKIHNKVRYGDNFGHGLGHGVGLEIHENQDFHLIQKYYNGKRHGCDSWAGIYIWISRVRIEDMIIINDDSPINLTSTIWIYYIIE